jgi:prephenate dehydratase
MPYSQVSHVFTLGPAGTFSDHAAQRVCSNPNSIHYTHNFNEAIVKVAETTGSVAVVPIENSVAGTVTQIQDALIAEDLVILHEFPMRIRYALFANAPLHQVTKFYAHEQAFGQTLQYTSHHMYGATHIYTHSNTDSAEQYLARVNAQEAIAAIVPINLAETYAQHVVAEDVQDYPNNTTRFVVVRKREETEKYDFALKKTSLFIEFEEDRAGLLYEMLGVFNRFQINLCRLESRPSKNTPWVYVFYVDFYNCKSSRACLQALKEAGFTYRILGTYDVLG